MSNEEDNEQISKNACDAIEMVIAGYLCQMAAAGYCDEHMAIRLEAVLATVCDSLHTQHGQPLLVLRDMLDDIIKRPNDPHPDLH